MWRTRFCAVLASALAFLATPSRDVIAATWHEDFSTDPGLHGWSVHGDMSLFTWDAGNQRLAATWDSTRTNTFFLHRLGTVLARTDAFRFRFRIRLDEVRSLGGSGTFQLAVGLLRSQEALAPKFLRGSGVNPTSGPRDLVEFNYFPAGGAITPTFAAVAVGTNNLRWAMANLFPLELTPEDLFQVEIALDADRQVLSLSVSRNDVPYSYGEVDLDARFGDFRVDAFSITSYSGAGQPAGYGGELFAKGWIDDIEIQYPDPPRVELTWFTGEPMALPRAKTPVISGWDAALERTRNPEGNPWETVDGGTRTVGTAWVFEDPAPPADSGFYRVRLERR